MLMVFHFVVIQWEVVGRIGLLVSHYPCWQLFPVTRKQANDVVWRRVGLVGEVGGIITYLKWTQVRV